MGVLFKSRLSSSHRGTHSSSCSFWRFVPSCGGSHHIGTVFIASGTRLSHRERVCCPAHSGGSCPPVGVLVALGTRSSCRLSSRSFQRFVPPMGVLFKFWEVQVVIAGECVHRVVRHPTHPIGFCPPVGVLFEFREVQVVIVLSGTCSLCRSSSHSFHFIIWPSLSVSNS